MFKKYFIVSLSLLSGCLLYAQTSSLSGVKSQLNTMFSGLDKTKVPTGYLWDTAVNLIEGANYDGTALTDSNFVSLPVMGDMLTSINSASVGADTICVQAALSRIERNSSLNNCMVGILFQPYNYIVGNALTDNLISYSNGIVSDVYQNGIWRNPYGETVLFGYATGNDGVVCQNTTFTIANIDSLSTQVFQSIQFDPGDGNGFRTVSIGGMVAVSYLSIGYIETKLRVTVAGITYQSHSIVLVKDNTTPDGIEVDSLPEIVSANYQNKSYSASITLGSTVNFHKRPLIVSEGFDPWKLSEHPYDSTGFTNITDVTFAYDSLSHSIIFSNYDVYYVDWHNYGADIRANAEVFKEVIRRVNDYNQSGEPNVVLGQSMGGLIARYALRDMELNNELHNTTLFISHDVPYMGANVSPGLLYTYWDIHDIASTFSEVFSFFPKIRNRVYELLRLGNFTSVKQMLPLYMNASWQYDSTLYDELQSELSQMGFPRGDPSKNIENVAIVNGGRSPQGPLSLYNTGDTLLDIDLELTSGIIPEMMLFVFSLYEGNLLHIPGKATLSFQHTVYPFLENSSLIRETELVYTKKLLWLLPLTITLFSKDHSAPSSGTPLDAVSSSYYDVSRMGFIDNFYYHTHSHLDSLWLGYYSARLTRADRISFIPTASAMAMPISENYNRDFFSSLPTPGINSNNTPFTSYILQNNSTGHTDFFPGISDWLETVTQTEISCPSLVIGGETATLSGNPHNYPFTWTATDAVSINSTTGQIDTTSYGFTCLTATCRAAGKVITKSKRVFVGLPQMTLSVNKTANGTFKVWANPVRHGVDEIVRQAVSDSLLTYVWGIKEGTSDIVWQSSSSSDTLYVAGSSYHRDLVVLLKVRAWNGSESSPVFVNVDSTIGFMMNLNTVSKSKHGDIVYELLPTWQVLVDDYGHDCLVLYNYGSLVCPFEPLSITLDSYTYPLTEKRTLQDGTVLFVFDVLYDQTFHDVFYEATLPYNNPSTKSIYVNVSLGVYEEQLVLCLPATLPLPI